MKRFWRDERGATAIEYGMLAAMIALVIIGSVSLLGEKTGALYDDAATAISTALGG